MTRLSFARCAFAMAALIAMPLQAREVRLKFPPGLLDRTERIDITGMGGGRSGKLMLGSSTGEFNRQADRIGIVDPLFAKNYGGGAVRIRGAEVDGDLSTSCRFRRLQTTLGIVSISAKRLTYGCTFERDGKLAAARLDLRDRDGALGSADGRDAREGVIQFEGTELRIRSIHRLAGSPFATPHALGYLFERDGVAVGEVDLNGKTKRVYAPAGTGDRDAVIAASLALAVFWDPALVDPAP